MHWYTDIERRKKSSEVFGVETRIIRCIYYFATLYYVSQSTSVEFDPDLWFHRSQYERTMSNALHFKCSNVSKSSCDWVIGWSDDRTIEWFWSFGKTVARHMGIDWLCIMHEHFGHPSNKYNNKQRNWITFNEVTSELTFNWAHAVILYAEYIGNIAKITPQH